VRKDLWLTLTDADRELLRELAAGKSMKQAAHALQISVRAAHFRWQSCRNRLECETPAHAIALLAGDALEV
jgi:DNA-binding CsgD family transcriptional regulator